MWTAQNFSEFGSSEALIAAMPVDGKSNASDWGCNKSELWLYTGVSWNGGTPK